MRHDQYRAHAEAQSAHWWFAGRRALFRTLADTLLATSTMKRIVDLGCGTGANAAAFAPAHHYLGVDASDEAIQWARRLNVGASFLQGSVGSADVDQHLQRADLVLLTDVLEHIDAEDQFFRRIIETVPVGCFLIITVPADMRLWSDHDETLGHFRRYDRESLRSIWDGLPVHELLLSYCNSRLYWPIRALRRLGRWRRRALGQAGTDLFAVPPCINACLARVVSGEVSRLEGALREEQPRVYQRGVGLIAILRSLPNVDLIDEKCLAHANADEAHARPRKGSSDVPRH